MTRRARCATRSPPEWSGSAPHARRLVRGRRGGRAPFPAGGGGRHARRRRARLPRPRPTRRSPRACWRRWGGELRFAHALTRDAVRAGVPTATAVALHRAAAEALEAHWAGELDAHLAELAWHRIALAPYGEAAQARGWALRAAESQCAGSRSRRACGCTGRRWRSPAPWPDDAAACRTHLALGRAGYLAGDLGTARSAAVAAAGQARPRGRRTCSPRPRWCSSPSPTRRRTPWSPRCARRRWPRYAADDGACGRACWRAQPARVLRGRPRADRRHERRGSRARPHRRRRPFAGRGAARPPRRRPGPARPPGATRAGRGDAGARPTAPALRPPAMWGRLWRIDALVEDGRIADAADELGPLAAAVERVGGPVSAWHRDRATACVAQAPGPLRRGARGRDPRGYERMRVIERSPATGAFLGSAVDSGPPRRAVRRGPARSPDRVGRAAAAVPHHGPDLARVPAAARGSTRRGRRPSSGRPDRPRRGRGRSSSSPRLGAGHARRDRARPARRAGCRAGDAGAVPRPARRRQRRELLRPGRAHPRARRPRPGPARRRRCRPRKSRYRCATAAGAPALPRRGLHHQATALAARGAPGDRMRARRARRRERPARSRARDDGVHRAQRRAAAPARLRGRRPVRPGDGGGRDSSPTA